jgi:hypothetical protein
VPLGVTIAFSRRPAVLGAVSDALRFCKSVSSGLHQVLQYVVFQRGNVFCRLKMWLIYSRFGVFMANPV